MTEKDLMLAVVHDVSCELVIILSAAERVIDVLPADDPEFLRAMDLRSAAQRCADVMRLMLRRVQELS